MRSAWTGLVVALGLALSACAAAPVPRRAAGGDGAKPIEANVDAIEGRPIESVPEALVPARPVPRGAAPKVEGHLGKEICSGKPGPKERPQRAACCYPAKELVLRPLRASFPELRACYDARDKHDAEGRVGFRFRIEKDGSLAHVCADETSTMDDEGAVRCMVEALRKVRYPGSSDADIDSCGLMTITYPVVFEP